MSDPMTPAVREWMKRTDADPPDAQQSARQVMTRLPEVRQRHRWWPIPVFYRRAKSPSINDTAEYQPSPIPATNGQTPTVIGRTQSMFSPSKAIIASALVFGIGGMLLIAQPFEQRSSPLGASADVAPTWVTGTIATAGSCSDPVTEADGDVTHSWNYVCSPQLWTASDPRLNGEAASVWNDDEYRMDDGGVKVVNMSALFVRNDGGGWTCSSPNLLGRGGLFPAGLTGGGATYTCVGDDGYAGLSAILVLDGAKGYSRGFTGLVFSGDLPPLPEPPATE